MNIRYALTSLTLGLICSAGTLAAPGSTGFEDAPPGAFTVLQTQAGEWSAEAGHAQINTKQATLGNRCLRITGGQDRIVELQLPESTQGKTLRFNGRRWTRKDPFQFRVAGRTGSEWKEIYNGDKEIATGGFQSEAVIVLPDGTDRLRFSSTTWETAGVAIDNVRIENTGSSPQPAPAEKQVSPAVAIKRGEVSGSRPNILLIVSEDNGQELSCYGDKNIQTPHLDSLARDGMLFENAYVTQSVCSPSRSSIFTGLYPHQNGHIGLATHKYAMFKKWPTTYSMMKKAGYTTGLLGKTHINPASIVENFVDFRAIKSNNFAKKNLKAYAEKSAEFIKQAGDTPFFLTVNYPDAHHPLQNQVQGRPEKPLKPDEVGTIPFIGHQNERMQKVVAAYYNCMIRLDECVGELLEELEKSGKMDNTFIIYIGDHGAQLPRGKIFATEAGMKIPYIVKWPGKIEKGVRSEKLVSTIDFMPTFADLAGAEPPKGLPGKSLLPLVTGESEAWREYIAYERNADAINLYYPQRALRDSRYKIIWSPLAAQGEADRGAIDNITQKKWIERGCSYSAEEVENLPPNIKKAYKIWITPPEYQLYDLQNDEWEFNNLAGDRKYAKIEKRMKKALEEWMEETDDWAADPDKLEKLTDETDSLTKAGKGKYPKGGWQYLNYLK